MESLSTYREFLYTLMHVRRTADSTPLYVPTSDYLKMLELWAKGVEGGEEDRRDIASRIFNVQIAEENMPHNAVKIITVPSNSHHQDNNPNTVVQEDVVGENINSSSEDENDKIDNPKEKNEKDDGKGEKTDNKKERGIIVPKKVPLINTPEEKARALGDVQKAKNIYSAQTFKDRLAKLRMAEEQTKNSASPVRTGGKELGDNDPTPTSVQTSASPTKPTLGLSNLLKLKSHQSQHSPNPINITVKSKQK